MDWKRLHLYTAICFSLCILAITYSRDSNSETKFSFSVKPGHYFESSERNEIREMFKGVRRSGRRLLAGSSPPRCTSKCGKCTPCKAVHVAVPPGVRVTTEYYPEAWRCKCGNKLYMP